MFRRTSAACNLLSDKLSHVRIHSEGSSTQLGGSAATKGSGGIPAANGSGGSGGGEAPMSQDGAGVAPAAAATQHEQQQQQPQQQPLAAPTRQPSQQLIMRGLTIDTTRYPSQSDMAWCGGGLRGREQLFGLPTCCTRCAALIARRNLWAPQRRPRLASTRAAQAPPQQQPAAASLLPLPSPNPLHRFKPPSAARPTMRPLWTSSFTLTMTSGVSHCMQASSHD